MASTVSASTATVSVTNMKPDTGEQADALWAQKIADGIGHVYFREIPMPDLAPTTTAEPRFIFTKRASHNGIKTLSRGLAAGAVTEYMRVYEDGADPTDPGDYSAVGTLSYSRADQTTQRFDLNISGLTNGQVYLLTFSRDTSVSSVRPAAFLVHGSNATY